MTSLPKRHGLRPVEATQQGEKVQGYFHGFGTEGDQTEGMGMYATVELLDGSIGQYDAYTLQFLDVDPILPDHVDTTEFVVWLESEAEDERERARGAKDVEGFQCRQGRVDGLLDAAHELRKWS